MHTQLKLFQITNYKEENEINIFYYDIMTLIFYFHNLSFDVV